MARKRKEWSLYRRDGVFYVRFWLEDQRRYSSGRSTGETRQDYAGVRAKEMYDAGGYRKRADDPLVFDFLFAYWRDPARKISASYRSDNLTFIEKHVAGFPDFINRRLSALRKYMLNRLKDYLESDEGMTPRMVNRTLQAVTVPIHFAVSRGLAPQELTGKTARATEEPEERGALTLDEIEAVAELQWSDIRQKAAVLLGALAGMRRGEVRALTWSNVILDGPDPIIKIRSNFVRYDGFKKPKARSSRDVGLLSWLADCLREVHSQNPYRQPTDLVLQGTAQGRPISDTTIRRGWAAIMDAIGIHEAERKERRLVFHSTRHSFTSFAREDLADYVVQRMTGHKSTRMLDNYSHVSRSTVNEARDVLERKLGEKRKASGEQGETSE